MPRGSDIRTDLQLRPALGRVGLLQHGCQSHVAEVERTCVCALWLVELSLTAPEPPSLADTPCQARPYAAYFAQAHPVYLKGCTIKGCTKSPEHVRSHRGFFAHQCGCGVRGPGDLEKTQKKSTQKTHQNTENPQTGKKPGFLEPRFEKMRKI